MPGSPRRAAPGPAIEAGAPTEGDDLLTLPVDDGDATEGDPASAFRAASFAERYRAGELIGAGGMGDVRGVADRLTGRTIAMKTLRAGHDGDAALRRFAREARVQAQLEHPAIVPVYDAGVDAQGDLFFTMKRVRGDSLADVLRRLREGRADVVQRFTRRKLLTVLSTVAMTLEYAHRRGVVHRDLKPANVMIGALDEVYVLDWGLADLRPRAATDAATPAPTLLATASRRMAAMRFAAGDAPLVDSSLPPATLAGQVVGTPGYIAPEQLDDPERGAEPAADVYALGVMLFESLTFQRLHLGDTVAAVFDETLALDGASPRERASARDVPPELDALCRAATRRDPAARPASAAAFARALEAYLDGDRDLAQRRALSARASEIAAAALTRSRQPDADETAARAVALREVTAALGLDPTNPRARATLVRLLTEASPAAETAAAAAHHDDAVRAFKLAARNHVLGMLTYALYLPLVFAMGVRSWPAFGAMAASICAIAALSLHYVRRPPPTLRLPLVHLALAMLALICGVVLFGPFVLVPAIAIITGVGYLATFGDRPRVILGCMLFVVLAPAILQAVGAVPPSYAFEGGAIIILPRATELPAVATQILLLATHAVVIAGSLVFVWRLRRTQLEAERRLRVQAWTLSQLVPDEPPGRAD